ncbi:MAG: peptidyl-alpha-hydroxyglycine alpha-amidating lyase family protein [Dehalococcoidales bacterium]|nr:peptidyl-alpha-hydroxyglycine alpha-amidating lyase family protein [Dehalococcoidales bacterium]
MSTRVGVGSHRYEVVEGWGKLPEDWRFVDVAGVAVNSEDNVIILNRGTHPIVVLDRAGNLLGAFGDGEIRGAHGVCVGPDDAIFCADSGDHTVKKYGPDGKLLMVLGIRDQPSDTGYDRSLDWPQREVKRAAGPFHCPTNVAVSQTGEIFVSDGYGNARVHKFAPDGTLLRSWGNPGHGPGEFWIPHGIAVDRESIVYVADRENSRVQRFSPGGEYLGEWSWVYRPTDLFIDQAGYAFVAEFGYRAGPVPGQLEPPGEVKPRGRVSIRALDGSVLAAWGEGPDDCAPGFFFAPHAVSIDSHGDLYVGEVVYSAGQRGKLVSPECHTLQKFARVS